MDPRSRSVPLLRRRRIGEAATGAGLAMTFVALAATLFYLLFGQNLRRVLGATSERGIGGTTEVRSGPPPRPQPPR